MKRYLTILALLMMGILPANADYIATHNFEVDADTTMTVVVSGNTNTSISGMAGVMSTPLDINFNISTNQDVNGITLKAAVIDSLGTKCSACCGCDTSTPATSLMTGYTLANDTHRPNSAALENCKKHNPQSKNNPNAIVYPATITINNAGTVQKTESGGDIYFTANVKSGITDLNLAISPTPKAGTYDIATAQDEPDNYTLEVFLDNIPTM